MTKTIIVEPIDQPRDGYSFNTGGSVGFYDEQGSDVSVSVTIAHAPISFTVKTGAWAKTGGTISVYIPAGNKRYKVKLIKTYEVMLFKVDCYDKGVYQYSYYRDMKTLTGINGYAYEI